MSSQSSIRRDLGLLISASILWGTVGIANQFIDTSSQTNALTLAFFRLIIAAPLFLLAAWRLPDRRFSQIKARDLGIMLVMGALQALYQVTYSAAIPLVGVTVATLIALCGAPVMLALFSACVLRERLKPLTWLAFLAALVGTILLVLGSSRAGGSVQHVSYLGVLLATLAAAGYAGFILCGRLVSSRYHSLQVNAIAFGSGACLLLCFTPISGLALNYPLGDWLLLLYLGCIPTALAYGLFQAGLGSLSATIVSIVTLVEPLTAALLAWLLFHETLTLSGMLGAILLPGSLLIILLTSE